MQSRSLGAWLRWQESLHPRSIDLQLDRVRTVSARLGCRRPAGPVFTVAGTNGKGSTVALLDACLRRAGWRTGVYTSPHLVAYNERIRLDGQVASDAALIGAFERVEQARGDIPLTFFEFGTLAAFEYFTTGGADAWVLEVGMGGRLDAVNVIDADIAIITTVDLDHQAFLGDTVEQIAAEKAAIMRAGRPVLYGDWPVPQAVRDAAAGCGARLYCLGKDFDFTPSHPLWCWRSSRSVIEGLVYPVAGTGAQLRNISVALAALEQLDAKLIGDVSVINELIVESRPPGRFQIVPREQQWILDVAHNAQAVATLRAQLETLPAAADTSIVIGMLGDKNIAAFAAELGPLAQRWIACGVDDPRALSADSIAADLRSHGIGDVRVAISPEDAFVQAKSATAPGGRIIVCGSFRVVGPALCWLGIY